MTQGRSLMLLRVISWLWSSWATFVGEKAMYKTIDRWIATSRPRWHANFKMKASWKVDWLVTDATNHFCHYNIPFAGILPRLWHQGFIFAKESKYRFNQQILLISIWISNFTQRQDRNRRVHTRTNAYSPPHRSKASTIFIPLIHFDWKGGSFE